MEIQSLDLKPVVQPLVAWYKMNKRDLPWRHDPTPYRVWVSEIMLQQTRVDPVIPYYLRFMERLPDVYALAACPEDELMKLWEGLGYYSRARNLQKAACRIVEAGSFPKDFEGWKALPGIGEYTAGAICSIALGLPTPAVDGNVLRVLSRVSGSFSDIMLPAVKKDFATALRRVYPPNQTSDFTQALMELGAIVCLPNGAPLCARCPLRALCTAEREGLIDRIPVKAEKKKRRIDKKTVLILRCGNKIALSRRPETGLLANLWEFPSLPGFVTEKELAERIQGLLGITRLESSTHLFTHIEWQMIGYELHLSCAPPGYEWVTIEEALFQKAIPSALRCYSNHLKNLRYEE